MAYLQYNNKFNINTKFKGENQKMGTKQIKLNIEQVFNARQAISRLLQCNGIPTKASYWLGRNWEKLSAIAKRWELEANPIARKYFGPESQRPYITPDDMEALEKEIREIWTDNFSLDSLMATIQKHQKRIFTGNPPIEIKKAYEEEINAKAQLFDAEVEFWSIEKKYLERAFTQIPGGDFLALEFMLEENSMLEIPNAGIQLVQ